MGCCVPACFGDVSGERSSTNQLEHNDHKEKWTNSLYARDVWYMLAFTTSIRWWQGADRRRLAKDAAVRNAKCNVARDNRMPSVVSTLL